MTEQSPLENAETLLKLNRRKFLLGLAGFGLLSWRSQDAEAYQPFEPFSFAYVTDVHLCNDVPDSFIVTRESQLFLQDLVKDLNAQKVDFVIFGGDQVETPGNHDSNWGLFTDVVQSLTMPWTFVLGDRDVSASFGVDKMRTYGADWKNQGIQTTTPYWSHNLSNVPNVHIIGLDTSLPNTTIGGMSKRQLDWLKQDLTDNKRFFTIVVGHHPLLPPPPYDGGPPWDEYVIPDGGAVREVLAPNSQVKLVLSGHVHVTKVQPERDIWHISNPSLCVYPCAYRIFHVTPQTVTMETRQIAFPALVKKARRALIDSSMASRFSRSNPENFVEFIEGTREDRACIIPMTPGKQLEPYKPKKEQPRKEQQKEEVQKDEPREHDTSPKEERPRHRFGRHRKSANSNTNNNNNDANSIAPEEDKDPAPEITPMKRQPQEQSEPNTGPLKNFGSDSSEPDKAPPVTPEDIDKVLNGNSTAPSNAK